MATELLKDRPAHLNLDHIIRVNWATNNFDRPILENDHKRLLQALGRKPASRHEDESPDLVQGKGKGLIILPHGAPGTGETSTAE